MQRCEFSAPVAGYAAVFSPSSSHFASMSGSKVTVRRTKTLSVSQIYQCIDKVDRIEFSPDSNHIMCAQYSRNAIQVFSIQDPTWKCRINEGVAGVINAYWGLSSNAIITESDFGIQLSVWSLTDSTSTIISSPKQPSGGASQLVAFCDCVDLMAVVHRIEMQDYIGVYATSPMEELAKFKARSNDISTVNWVPQGTHIVTSDSPLSYRFCVYLHHSRIIPLPVSYLTHRFLASSLPQSPTHFLHFRRAAFLDVLLISYHSYHSVACALFKLVALLQVLRVHGGGGGGGKLRSLPERAGHSHTGKKRPLMKIWIRVLSNRNGNRNGNRNHNRKRKVTNYQFSNVERGSIRHGSISHV